MYRLIRASAMACFDFSLSEAIAGWLRRVVQGLVSAGSNAALLTFSDVKKIWGARLSNQTSQTPGGAIRIRRPGLTIMG